MNTDVTGNGTNSHGAEGISTAAVVVRAILALMLCILVWLCGRNSVMTERMDHVFRQLFTGDLPDDLSGFLWQHPRMLLAFAVIIAIAGLAFLAFSRVQRRAVLAAALAAVVLLAQWLIVTSSVYYATMRTMDGVAELPPPATRSPAP